MQRLGVNPLVIPHGLSASALVLPARQGVAAFHARLPARTVLSKVARWDPDKRWLLALDTVRAMKRLGWQPFLIARGGVEAYGEEVRAAAAGAGLRVAERTVPQPGVRGLLHALEHLEGVDMVHRGSPLDLDHRRVLFRGSDAVLAHSAHEPFGLVGLETMAVGGGACTGGSGADYAVPGQNALVLETTDPQELIGLLGELPLHPAQERALRQAGRVTARHDLWPQILSAILLPRLRLLASCSADAAPRSLGGAPGHQRPGVRRARGASGTLSPMPA